MDDEMELREITMMLEPLRQFLAMEDDYPAAEIDESHDALHAEFSLTQDANVVHENQHLQDNTEPSRDGHDTAWGESHEPVSNTLQQLPSAAPVNIPVTGFVARRARPAAHPLGRALHESFDPTTNPAPRHQPLRFNGLSVPSYPGVGNTAATTSGTSNMQQVNSSLHLDDHQPGLDSSFNLDDQQLGSASHLTVQYNNLSAQQSHYNHHPAPGAINSMRSLNTGFHHEGPQLGPDGHHLQRYDSPSSVQFRNSHRRETPNTRHLNTDILFEGQQLGVDDHPLQRLTWTTPITPQSYANHHRATGNMRLLSSGRSLGDEQLDFGSGFHPESQQLDSANIMQHHNAEVDAQNQQFDFGFGFHPESQQLDSANIVQHHNADSHAQDQQLGPDFDLEEQELGTVGDQEDPSATKPARGRYTKAEEDKFRGYVAREMTDEEIGKKLGRSRNAINIKRNRMQNKFGDPHKSDKKRKAPDP